MDDDGPMASAHQKIDDHERRKARARIERSDEGYEITLSSELDDSFLHFVSRAPAKRSTPKGSVPATAPQEPS